MSEEFAPIADLISEELGVSVEEALQDDCGAYAMVDTESKYYERYGEDHVWISRKLIARIAMKAYDLGVEDSQDVVLDYERLEKIMLALIHTTQKATDLDNVYNDVTNEGFSWEQVERVLEDVKRAKELSYVSD